MIIKRLRVTTIAGVAGKVMLLALATNSASTDAVAQTNRDLSSNKLDEGARAKRDPAWRKKQRNIVGWGANDQTIANSPHAKGKVDSYDFCPELGTEAHPERTCTFRIGKCRYVVGAGRKDEGKGRFLISEKCDR